MGGHGGLNILPQKSWNVYGQKNRQKVAEDEAERDKKEAKAQAQQERSARELRLRALRGSLQEASPTKEGLRPQEADHVTISGTASAAHQKHINFWEDLEKTEAKANAKRRGDPKTQTSDARFDERFAVMHGLAGKVPWYAEADLQQRKAPQGSPEWCSDTVPGNYHNTHYANDSSADRKHRHESLKRTSRQSRSPSPDRKRRHDKHKHEKKAERRKHKRQHTRHARSGDSGNSSAGPTVCTESAGQPGGKSRAELRAERLQREEAEAARSKALLQRHYA